MEKLLDSPIWNALCTGNKHLAFGNDEVKYFDAEVSPFVAFSEDKPQHFDTLASLLTRESPSLLFSRTEINIPEPWKVLRVIPGYQMVHNGRPFTVDATNLTTLTAAHIPQMLELTKLTSPGPFATRTIEFGHYQGVIENGELAAMAGQRFNPGIYAEISAVCTHPNHTGKGYARQLMAWQANRIIAEGNIPILHVAASNARAIKVYESTGFAIRIPVWFYLIKQR